MRLGLVVIVPSCQPPGVWQCFMAILLRCLGRAAWVGPGYGGGWCAAVRGLHDGWKTVREGVFSKTACAPTSIQPATQRQSRDSGGAGSVFIA